MKKIALLLSCFIPLGLWGQSGKTLPETFITSARTPVKSEEIGHQVLTLTARDIAALPVQSFDELLRYVGGIEVQQRGPMGTQANFLIRGGTFQQVLVLLDQMRLNDPLTGHFSSYLPLPLSEIERIEVLKGPAAAVYGPDAVGGVIHIITKSFNHNEPINNTHSATFNGKVGDYGYQSQEIGATAGWKKATLFTGLSTQSSDGFPARDGRRNFFRLNSGSLSAKFQLKPKLYLSIRSSADYRDFSARNFYTSLLSDTAMEQVTQWWNQARITWKHDEKSSTVADAVFKYTTDFYRFNPIATPNEHVTRLANMQVLHFHQFKKHRLNLGIQADQRSILSNDRGNHITNHGAIFVHHVYTPIQGLTLNTGLRADADDNYGLEWLPQFFVAYRKGMLHFRGGVGRGIRAAEFTERFNNYNKSLVAGGSIGNPNLEAERSWSYESGIDLHTNFGLKFGGTVFRRASTNLIDWVLTPMSEIPRNFNLVTGRSYNYAQNLRSTYTQGFELDMEYRKSWSNSNQLILKVGYLNVYSEAAEQVISAYLIAHANQVLNSQLQWRSKWINVGVNYLWKQRASIRSSTLNVSLPAEVHQVNAKIDIKANKTLIFNIQCLNLSNNSIQDFNGADMPGRWWMGGLSISL